MGGAVAAAMARSGRISGRRRRHRCLRTPPGLTGSYQTGGKAGEFPRLRRAMVQRPPQGAFPHNLCRSMYLFGGVRGLHPPRSHMYRPGPTGSIGQEFKTRVHERHGSGSKWAAQGRTSCRWPWGGIVVRELFPTGGGRSSTATRGYESCSRTGAQGNGRFGGAHEHDYEVGYRQKICPHGKSSDPLLWYGGPTELLRSGGPWGQAVLYRSRRSKGDTPDHVAARV